MGSFVLFSSEGGVGKTALTFSIAHMLSRVAVRVAVLDYDPQCNLSAALLAEDQLADCWESPARSGRTVSDCVDPLRRGVGEIVPPYPVNVADNLWLLPGQVDLSRFEQALVDEWPKTSQVSNERALNVTTALDLLSDMVAQEVGADVVLLDVGPSLGALNRAALLAADAVVVPVAPDLFSLQGLRNLGPTLREWRADWTRVRSERMSGRSQENLTPHEFRPVGYIVQQHLARSDRPVSGHARWAARIPIEFRESVLDDRSTATSLDIAADPQCIGTIKHFASLVPIAQIARKPLFDLKQADGIGGGQIQAVAACRIEFERLAREILVRIGVETPTG